MAESREDKVGRLLEEALERPPDERAAFLEEACEEEPLREEVLSLLEAIEEAPGFFENLAAAMPEELLEGEEAGEERLRADDPLGLEGQKVGRYAVEEHLGGGGMGVVYRARDPELGRPVALKFLPPHLATSEEADRRFVREARAASALEHPHIATIYEIGRAEEGPAKGQRFIAMAYYEGETLKEKIGREGPLPIEEAVGYAEQIAEALSSAHEAGIVHRDVKPANVMVTEAGEVKLVDFGLARIAGRSQLTEPGRRLGTAAYMSPEQAEGKEVGPEADQWALGVLLYEMLTGERPFGGKRSASVLRAVLDEDPVPIGKRRGDVPPALEQVVGRCLRKDPGERYALAERLLKDLRGLRRDAAPGEGSAALEDRRLGREEESSPGGPLAGVRRFVRELRRRRVIRVAVVYAGTAFVLLQLGEILVEPFGLPGWTLRMVTFLLILGFPLAVGLAWVFDVTEEGLVRTGTEEESLGVLGRGGKPFTSDPVLIGLLVLIAGLLLYPRVFPSGEKPTSAGQPAATDTTRAGEHSIAVLPFEVSGSGAEDWRDGMVTALSLNLDGAAGLRTIADRTVFAAWEKRGTTGKGASTQEALEVARSVGAKYAIIGSALKLGEELRLGAEVRRTVTGERLGQVEVQGSQERITGLTDRLTRKVLGVLLERSGGELPPVDLASITTESVEALKDFLEGERHFRAAEYEAAAEDFEAAIRTDSTFALAYARLASARYWLSEPEPGNRALRRAYERSGQLPERARRLIEALHMRRAEHRPLAAAERLRQLTEDYPKDPSVWYNLGELVFHANVPRGLPEVGKAMGRAIALDPGHFAYYPHYVHATFVLNRDSAVAARRVQAMPEEEKKWMYRYLLKLAYGTPAQRRRALSRLDTLSIPVHWFPADFLQAPTDLGLRDEVLRTLVGREDLGNDISSPWRLLANDLLRGQVGQFHADLEQLGVDTYTELSFLQGMLAGAISLGIPIDSTARRYLAPENLPTGPSPNRLLSSGLYLVERGRDGEIDPLLGRIRAAAETPRQEEALVAELKGYRAFRAGNLKRARRLSSRSNEWYVWGALWRGDLYQKLNRLKKAEGWYQVAWIHPVAYERLGRLYEEMGKPEKARAAYERFVEAWKNADPKLQDRVEKARERLQALSETKAAE